VSKGKPKACSCFQKKKHMERAGFLPPLKELHQGENKQKARLVILPLFLFPYVSFFSKKFL
jgi:hypothetical protein